ncbi:LuxR C-terminal-related transcriptional regulator [Actinoplanes sp. GCM10030250]|uniref:LuxR C-terminal-related transcriptional regulator n=1 Tax=Actinoplanes sp. GCM10030250 TaxID=3273376 RepID=UPI0036193EF8
MSLQPHQSLAGDLSGQPVLAPHLQETIESLAAGETAREMAARLYISTNTVKSRLRTLYRQLGARDQAHAVAIAFRLGVLRTMDGPVPRRDGAAQAMQPVVIASLNPQRLRTTIADLTALLRVAEVSTRPDSIPSGASIHELLHYVGELARGKVDHVDDPHEVLARIAEIAEAATSPVEDPLRLTN